MAKWVLALLLGWTIAFVGDWSNDLTPYEASMETIHMPCAVVINGSQWEVVGRIFTPLNQVLYEEVMARNKK